MLKLLALAALAYLAICAVVFVLQRSMIYYPQPRAGGGGSTLELEVDGERVLVSVRPRSGAKALVYFGGNAEDVSSTLPALAAAFPEHALYLLHYRGYGGSSGAPSQDALLADALALCDHVRREHSHLTAVGRSLGSGVAVHVASERPVERLVLVTPYASLVDVASRHYPFLPVRLLLKDRFESWRRAPRVEAPTLLIAAEHDEVIPHSSAQALLASFPPGRARLEILAGAGHNSLDAHPRYARLLAGLE